jgi:outer membrane protein TolC
LLTSERQDVQIHGQQRTVSVALVKALGGGWNANDAAHEDEDVASATDKTPAR